MITITYKSFDPLDVSIDLGDGLTPIVVTVPVTVIIAKLESWAKVIGGNVTLKAVGQIDIARIEIMGPIDPEKVKALAVDPEVVGPFREMADTYAGMYAKKHLVL